jgi:DNA-binding MarR family transcriptional regulator
MQAQDRAGRVHEASGKKPAHARSKAFLRENVLRRLAEHESLKQIAERLCIPIDKVREAIGRGKRVDLFAADGPERNLKRAKVCGLHSVHEFLVLAALLDGPRNMQFLLEAIELQRSAAHVLARAMSARGLVSARREGRSILVSILPSGESAWDKWRLAEGRKPVFMPSPGLSLTPVYQTARKFDSSLAAAEEKRFPVVSESDMIARNHQQIRQMLGKSEVPRRGVRILQESGREELRELETRKRVAFKDAVDMVADGYDLKFVFTRLRYNKPVFVDITEEYLSRLRMFVFNRLSLDKRHR